MFEGATDQCVEAIAKGELDEAWLTSAEGVLLDYVELVTRAACRSTAEDVEGATQALGVIGYTETEPKLFHFRAEP